MKTFKLFLKSLISNNACIEGGRHRPWWLASLILLFSAVLALVPIFVKAITTQGDAGIASNAYALDFATERFVESINDNEVDMVIKSQDDGTKYLEVDPAKWNTVYTVKDTIAESYNVYQHKNSSDQVDFEVYYFQELNDDIINQVTVKKTINEEGKETQSQRTTSAMVLARNEFRIYIVNTQTKKAVSSIVCDYKYFNLDYNLRDLNGKKTTAEAFALPAADFASYQADFWNNFRDFCKKGYNTVRIRTAWATTGISAAIDVGLVLFFGFMIWVITRGKNNPFRVYTVWESQKISWWCALTPAILACGLGFAFANFAQVVFPLLIGVRIMWLAMRSLRPENVPAK